MIYRRFILNENFSNYVLEMHHKTNALKETFSPREKKCCLKFTFSNGLETLAFPLMTVAQSMWLDHSNDTLPLGTGMASSISVGLERVVCGGGNI